MTVYTGDVKNAGTDAEVKFNLFGHDGESQEIKLDKADERCGYAFVIYIFSPLYLFIYIYFFMINMA